MTYLINREEMLRIAKDLGLEIKFDSSNPGVINKINGEFRSLHSYFNNDLFNLNSYETVSSASFKTIDARKIGSKEIKLSGDNNEAKYLVGLSLDPVA